MHSKFKLLAYVIILISLFTILYAAEGINPQGGNEDVAGYQLAHIDIRRQITGGYRQASPDHIGVQYLLVMLGCRPARNLHFIQRQCQRWLLLLDVVATELVLGVWALLFLLAYRLLRLILLKICIHWIALG